MERLIEEFFEELDLRVTDKLQGGVTHEIREGNNFVYIIRTTIGGTVVVHEIVLGRLIDLAFSGRSVGDFADDIIYAQKRFVDQAFYKVKM